MMRAVIQHLTGKLQEVKAEYDQAATQYTNAESASTHWRREMDRLQVEIGQYQQAITKVMEPREEPTKLHAKKVA